MNERPAYTAGVQGGYSADALTNIQRRFFKRFPVDLHDEDPTADFLSRVNDGAPDAEPELPDRSQMSQEEYGEAIARLVERRKLIDFRKAVSQHASRVGHMC